MTIIGPVADDPSWQARAGEGFDKGNFVVDWDRQVVTCPAGKESISWLPNTYPKNGMVFEARFARRDCTPCPFRAQCTKSEKEPRIIGLQAREHHEALQGARREQKTEGFRSRYAARAGIEGTHEQAIRRCLNPRCVESLAHGFPRSQHVLRNVSGTPRSFVPAGLPAGALVMLTRLQADDPRLLLRLRALRPERARRAISPGEPRLKDHAVFRVGVGQPGDALLPGRAGHHLPVPVDDEVPLVEALAGAGLPTRIVGDRPDDRHAILALARDEDMSIRVALVDKVVPRE